MIIITLWLNQRAKADVTSHSIFETSMYLPTWRDVQYFSLYRIGWQVLVRAECYKTFYATYWSSLRWTPFCHEIEPSLFLLLLFDSKLPHASLQYHYLYCNYRQIFHRSTVRFTSSVSNRLFRELIPIPTIFCFHIYSVMNFLSEIQPYESCSSASLFIDTIDHCSLLCNPRNELPCRVCFSYECLVYFKVALYRERINRCCNM